ncbi:MAG TPA: hypothetical protein PKD24_12020 [Pyrinomonadaceae bacterium]|nr:hypothetical protein [Pyrinomonadaceae bacterium]HMP65975.1 hypothetical protein [Pyrinomonadaceae bacterium]
MTISLGIVRLSSLFVASCIFAVPVFSCSFYDPPLRTKFRHAKQVLVGTVLKVSPANIDKATRARLSHDKTFSLYDRLDALASVEFKITKRWKGSKDEVVVFVAPRSELCICSSRLSEFDVGKEYLIFAFHRDFVSYCDTLPPDAGYTTETMKRLDSFWFRTWARVFPF